MIEPDAALLERMRLKKELWRIDRDRVGNAKEDNRLFEVYVCAVCEDFKRRLPLIKWNGKLVHKECLK